MFHVRSPPRKQRWLSIDSLLAKILPVYLAVLPQLVLLPSPHFRCRGVDCMGMNAHPLPRHSSAKWANSSMLPVKPGHICPLSKAPENYNRLLGLLEAPKQRQVCHESLPPHALPFPFLSFFFFPPPSSLAFPLPPPPGPPAPASRLAMSPPPCISFIMSLNRFSLTPPPVMAGL